MHETGRVRPDAGHDSGSDADERKSALEPLAIQHPHHDLALGAAGFQIGERLADLGKGNTLSMTGSSFFCSTSCPSSASSLPLGCMNR